jgi:hypothetical protein
MTTQHTPTPWRYFKQGDGTRFHITARPTTQPGNNFDDFATVNIGNEADAAHIVRCVNEREGLIAALRFVADYTVCPVEVWEVARAALAKVEG